MAWVYKELERGVDLRVYIQFCNHVGVTTRILMLRNAKCALVYYHVYVTCGCSCKFYLAYVHRKFLKLTAVVWN